MAKGQLLSLKGSVAAARKSTHCCLESGRKQMERVRWRLLERLQCPLRQHALPVWASSGIAWSGSDEALSDGVEEDILRRFESLKACLCKPYLPLPSYLWRNQSVQ